MQNVCIIVSIRIIPYAAVRREEKDEGTGAIVIEWNLKNIISIPEGEGIIFYQINQFQDINISTNLST